MVSASDLRRISQAPTFAEKTRIARGIVESGRGGSRGTTSTIREVSPGVFSVRDPTTGKLIVTSSRSFAESIGGVGFTQALSASKAEGGGRAGRSRTRCLEEQ